MKKTSKQVQTDIIDLLRNSELAAEVTGEIYRKGYRPRDSKKEDIIVIFTTGMSDQIQTGVVTVNIYVPDIDPFDNGVFVEDGLRTEEIERLASEWVDSLNASVSGYKFKLRHAIYTEDEPNIHQHFVVIRLGYEYFDSY